MKLLTILAALLMSASAHAEDTHIGGIKCHLDTLTSVCGSGTIDLKLNQYGDFELDYGDVACWGSNSTYHGSMLPSKTTTFGTFNTVAYDLEAHSHSFFGGTPVPMKEPALVGHAEYDSTNNVVLLKIDKLMFNVARGETYHLKCEGKLLN